MDRQVDAAALDLLHRNILAHIDARHHELRRLQEGLFEKFQAELLGSLSEMTGMQNNARRPRQAQQTEVGPEPHGLFAPLCCRPDVAEMPLSQLRHATSVANNNVKFKSETYGEAPANPGHDGADDRRDKFARTVSVSYPTAQAQGLVAGLAPQQPETSNPESSQLHGDVTWDKERMDLGRPKGEFKGRINLFAFMQTNNWDSPMMMEPTEHQENPSDGNAKVYLSNSLWDTVGRVVKSTAFDLAVGAVILINALVMAITLEYEGGLSADKIGITADDDDWPGAEMAFMVMDHLFAVIYIIELTLRLLVIGREYFKSILNCMDFLVVMVAVVELYVFALIEANPPDMGLIRLLRVLKIVRILRILRVFKFFKKLRLLVVAVTNSMGSLVWSMLLLGLIQLIASIFMTQSLQSFLTNEDADPALREQVYTFFGTFTRSCISMFEITFAVGTWGRCGRVVIYSVNRLYAVFFLGYLAVVSFAMIRVIAAIFLKDTLNSAGRDGEAATADENKDPRYVKEIWDVFKTMDLDGDGQIDLFELHTTLQREDVCARLRKLGVVPHELPGLFTLMDDGDNEFSFCEFLTGIMRLKNAHKGIDLATLLYENKKILKRVLFLKDDIEKIRKSVGA